MSSSVRVYVNARGVDAPAGATVLDAVRLADAVEAGRISAGERAVTDSRGIPVPPDAPLFLGAIFRTVSARQMGAPAE